MHRDTATPRIEGSYDQGRNSNSAKYGFQEVLNKYNVELLFERFNF